MSEKEAKEFSPEEAQAKDKFIGVIIMALCFMLGLVIYELIAMLTPYIYKAFN